MLQLMLQAGRKGHGHPHQQGLLLAFRGDLPEIWQLPQMASAPQLVRVRSP